MPKDKAIPIPFCWGIVQLPARQHWQGVSRKIIGLREFSTGYS